MRGTIIILFLLISLRAVSQQADSIVNTMTNKINSVTKLDTLSESLVKRRAHFDHALDSAKQSVDARLKILHSNPKPDAAAEKKLVLLKGRLDSLQKAGPGADIKNAENKIRTVQTSLSSDIASVENKLTKKLSTVTNAESKILHAVPGGADALPSVKLPGIALPNTVGMGSIDPSLPKVSLPGVGDMKIPSSPVGEIPVDGIKIPEISAPSIGALAEVNKTTGELGKLSNTEKIETEAEKDVMASGAVKGLKGQLGEADKLKDLGQQWMSDPDFQKEKILDQAKTQVVNHFAENGQALTGMMSKTSKIKQKYKYAESSLDVMKDRQPNQMKGKTFAERLRPGINLQLQSRRDILLDLNPQAGYRITGRIMAGIGFNMRLGYNWKQKEFKQADIIFGPRAFGQFRLRDGLYAMATVEMMNTRVPPAVALINDNNNRAWVRGLMTGLKKEFRISPKLLSNMQLLYNITDPHGRSPYADRFNLRIGFELQHSRKK